MVAMGWIRTTGIETNEVSMFVPPYHVEELPHRWISHSIRNEATPRCCANGVSGLVCSNNQPAYLVKRNRQTVFGAMEWTCTTMSNRPVLLD